MTFSGTSRLTQRGLLAILTLALCGCAGLSGNFRDSADLAKQLPEFPAPAHPYAEVVNIATDLWTEPVARDGVGDLELRNVAAEMIRAAGGRLQLAQKAPSQPGPADVEIEEYDPWELLNEKMFDFNRGLDRWVIKPVAKGYNKVMPDPWQQAVGNAFSNIGFVPRMVNCFLQGKFGGAGRELLRFVVNTSLGLGGLIDIAGREGFKKCKADLGQTLGVWGVGPGPYLVLPFFPPLTVRDAIGYGVDGAMNPLSYFIYIGATFGMRAEDTVNDRSLNLDLYQGFEESTVEFYSALRNAYLQRRQKLIKEFKEE